MVEYIEKKKALGIYVLKAFVVDDQRHGGISFSKAGIVADAGMTLLISRLCSI